MEAERTASMGKAGRAAEERLRKARQAENRSRRCVTRFLHSSAVLTVSSTD